MVVENKAGTGGQIAAQTLKAAAPDGTTFFLSHDHTASILPLVVKNPGLDPSKDFVPVAGFATFVNARVVSGGTPARSFNEYVAWAKTQGNKGNVGILAPAPAPVPEILVNVLGEKYKVGLQAVPYRGCAPMMADMLGNQIGAGVASVPDFIENHKAGKVRVVAVLGNTRQAALPDVRPPLPSSAWPVLKTCRTTAFLLRRVRPKRLLTVSQASWPKLSPCPM